jgi:hypothetical protein
MLGKRCSGRPRIDSKGYLALQPEITTARADRKRVRSPRTHPRLPDDVPDRQIISRERDTDHLRLARLQLHVGEPAQDGWRLFRPRGEMQVQLGYLFFFFFFFFLAGKRNFRTSVPATFPMFPTVKDTVNAARCSQSAVDAPTSCGPGLPASQFASSCPSLSDPSTTGAMLRPEYSNLV